MTFDKPFQAYALVSSSLGEADIEFGCFDPQITHKLTSLIEESINYHDHAEPPLCGSCKEEGGHGEDEAPTAT
jgi:hypothetical protein